MIREKEYNAAVKEYAKNIFRYLHKSLKDAEACNDLVQDCFLKLWQHKDRVDKTKIKSWLFSVAHNGMLNYIKSRSKNIGLDFQHENIEDITYTDYDLKEILDKSLNELSPLNKSIVLLRDLEGYNYKEIGEILDLNESQVKVYLFRARQKMKTSIQLLSNSYDQGR